MRAHVKARFLDDIGEVTRGQYKDGTLALLFQADGEPRPDTLSINLTEYGKDAPPDHVWVGEYSEHEGLPLALVEAGVAMWADPPQAARFGTFDATATLMKVLV